MAISESTTQQSDTVKFQSRRLTVDRGAGSESKGPAPHIRIMGRWVEQAGFDIGSKVNVEVSHSRLIISALPDLPEREPHLPRRSEKVFDCDRWQAAKHRMTAIPEPPTTG